MKPNQYNTLVEALNGLAKRGFQHSFHIDGTENYIIETQKQIAPKECCIVEHHRFEGDSSAGDMSVVYAIETHSGDKGTIVDSFGAYANIHIADFIKNIPIEEER